MDLEMSGESLVEPFHGGCKFKLDLSHTQKGRAERTSEKGNQ